MSICLEPCIILDKNVVPFPIGKLQAAHLAAAAVVTEREREREREFGVNQANGKSRHLSSMKSTKTNSTITKFITTIFLLLQLNSRWLVSSTW